MITFFDISYNELTKSQRNELYQLRKRTFYDRLKWQVTCHNEMEMDEYDNHYTHYIVGVYSQQIICGVRLIPLSQPNMITHTFHHHFSDVSLPTNSIESSRFFVDKDQARRLLGKYYPVSYALFLAVMNYSMRHNIGNTYAIVSRAMLTILKRSNLQLTLVKKSFITPMEEIFLICVYTNKEQQFLLDSKVSDLIKKTTHSFFNWPVLSPAHFIMD